MGERAFPNFSVVGKFTKSNISELPQRRVLAKGFGGWGAKFRAYSTQNFLWKKATDKLSDHICDMCIPLSKEKLIKADFLDMGESMYSLTLLGGRSLALLGSQSKLKGNFKILDYVLDDLKGVPIIGPSLVDIIKQQVEYKDDKDSMARIISADTNKSELCLLAKELLKREKCDVRKASLLRNAVLSGKSKKQIGIANKIFPMGTNEQGVVSIVKDNERLLQDLDNENINSKISKYGDLFGLLKRVNKCIKNFSGNPVVPIFTTYLNKHS